MLFDKSKIELEDLGAANAPEPKTFLWFGCHDEGIQTWDIMEGKDLRDAIAREIIKNDSVIYFTMDDILRDIDEDKFTDHNALFDAMIENVIEYIENSYVDGDSSEQICVFDISDRSNIDILHPMHMRNKK